MTYQFRIISPHFLICNHFMPKHSYKSLILPNVYEFLIFQPSLNLAPQKLIFDFLAGEMAAQIDVPSFICFILNNQFSLIERVHLYALLLQYCLNLVDINNILCGNCGVSDENKKGGKIFSLVTWIKTMNIFHQSWIFMILPYKSVIYVYIYIL